MEGRCRGHCCLCFALSIPYDELKKSISGESKTIYKDGEQILDMLIPLGAMNGKEITERFGISSAEIDSVTEPKERFTCRHLQENGDCGIYETRPWMCRSYPSLKCEYNECQATCSTLAAIRAKEREVVFGVVKAE